MNKVQICTQCFANRCNSNGVWSEIGEGMVIEFVPGEHCKADEHPKPLKNRFCSACGRGPFETYRAMNGHMSAHRPKTR